MQTFATTAGQTYEVDFAGATGTKSGRDGTGIIDVMIGGSLAGTFNLSNTGTSLLWQNFSFEFTSTGSSTTLEFQNRQDAYLPFAVLDNVVVGLAETTPTSVLLNFEPSS